MPGRIAPVAFVCALILLNAAPARALPCADHTTVEAEAVGALALPHAVGTARQQGDLAYLGGYFNGFMVVDVSSVAAPQLVADVPCSVMRLNNPTWVEVGPGVAFVGGGYGEIPVFDLADPAAPQPLPEITVPFEVMATAYGDGRLYAATYGRRSYAGTDTSALHIFDVADPAAPVELAWLLDNHDWAYSLAYRDGVLFVGASSGLHAFTVVDPAAVHELDVIDVGLPVTAMEFAGDVLRAVDLFGTLHLIDAADPAALAPLAATDLRTARGEALFTKDAWTYVACGAAGLKIADAADPAAMPASWPTAGYCRAVGPTGDGGIWTTSGATLLGVTASPPLPTPLPPRVDLDQIPYRAVLAGDRLYVVDGDLTIIDVGDPAAPAMLGVYDDAVSYSSLSIAGDTAYLGSRSAGVVAVDVADPPAPVLLGVLTAEPTYSVLAKGTTVFVGPRDGALLAIDAGEPAAPVVLGTYAGDGPFRAYGLDLMGESLVMLAGATVEVLDVTDPAAITQAASLRTGAGQDVAVWADFIVAASSSSFKVLRFTAPGTLELLSERDVPGSIYDVEVRDALVYAACRYGGVHIYAIDEPTSLPLDAEPANPELVGIVPANDDVRCVAVGADLIAVPSLPYLDSRGFVDVFAPHCRVSAVGDPPPPPVPMLSASPNPFNPRVRIRFTTTTAGPVELTVHDLAGRRVRTMLAGELPAGPQLATWDGRDDAGRAAASGGYVVRLRAGAAASACKVTLLR